MAAMNWKLPVSSFIGCLPPSLSGMCCDLFALWFAFLHEYAQSCIKKNKRQSLIDTSKIGKSVKGRPKSSKHGHKTDIWTKTREYYVDLTLIWNASETYRPAQTNAALRFHSFSSERERERLRCGYSGISECEHTGLDVSLRVASHMAGGSLYHMTSWLAPRLIICDPNRNRRWGGWGRQTNQKWAALPTAEGITESCGIIMREWDVLFLKETLQRQCRRKVSSFPFNLVVTYLKHRLYDLKWIVLPS